MDTIKCQFNVKDDRVDIRGNTTNVYVYVVKFYCSYYFSMSLNGHVTVPTFYSVALETHATHTSIN